jgi:precorrin-6Y C5,15-methyltransferase (decarboxylating)
LAHRILVVGIPAIGPAGLPPHILDRIHTADVLCGGERHLSLFPGVGKERWSIGDNVEAVVERLQRISDRRVVVLATGDPLLFGIGSTLVRHLEPDRLEIIPHVSAVQEAFARVRVPWHDAHVVSVHGRGIDSVLSAVLTHPKVAIYTDPVNTPARLAAALLKAGSPDRHVVVAERLGLADERVHRSSLARAVEGTFDPLNVMLVLEPIEQQPSGRRGWDPDDQTLMQRRGQITRQEVRALSVLRIDPEPTNVVWDIGAGSGAVAIDIARRAPLARVFAIERDPDQQECIRTNLARTSVSSVMLVEGEAPQALPALPDPDRVFLGGTGGKLTAVLEHSWPRLRPNGRIVANLVVLDHVSQFLAWCSKVGTTPDVLLVQLSRGTPIVGSLRLEALNPVYILTVCREGSHGQH